MNEREIIIELLNARVLGCNYMRYLYNTDSNDIAGRTLVMFVICNELFYPGADAETIENKKDLEELYELWSKYQYAGVDIWVMKKRKHQPMQSNKNYLIENNLWLPEFDIFEINEFDI